MIERQKQLPMIGCLGFYVVFSAKFKTKLVLESAGQKKTRQLSPVDNRPSPDTTLSEKPRKI